MIKPASATRSLSHRSGRRLAVAVGLASAVGLTSGAVTRVIPINASQTVRLGDTGAVQDPTFAMNRSIEGDTVPHVAVEATDGRTVRTSTFIGSSLVVNFWYSACPPCKKELPDLAAVGDELANRVRLVGINPVDDAEAAIAFATEHGVNYDNFLDPDGKLLAALGVNVFPTTLLVRADGTIADQHVGAITADQLRAAIEQSLAHP